MLKISGNFVLAALIIALAVAMILPQGAQAEDGREIAWLTSLDKAKEKAKAFHDAMDGTEVQMIVVVIYDPEDPNSKKLLNTFFTDQNLVAQCYDYQMVKIDSTKNSELAKKLGIRYAPAMVFMNHEGQTLFISEGLPPGPKTIGKRIMEKDVVLQKLFSVKNELKEKPDDIKLKIKLGKTWLEFPRAEEAQKIFKKLESAAGDDNVVKAEIKYYLGRCKKLDHKTKDAEELYRKALELDPENNSKLHDLIEYEIAACKIDNANWKQALELFQAFITKYPNSEKAAKAHFSIGSCYYKLNKTDKAIEVWKEVAKKYPHTKEGKDALKNVKQLSK